MKNEAEKPLSGTRPTTAQLIPAGLLLAVLGLTFAPNELQLALRYDRSAISEGEIWRLLSGNLVHLGINHMLMNAAGLVLMWVIFGKQFTALRWLSVLLVSSLCVTTGLYLFNTSLSWYVGLSGTLHGIFILGLLENIRQGYRLEWMLLLLVSAKLAWEQVAGALPGSAEMAGGPVVVDAHLYGAIGGLITAVAMLVLARRPAQH